MGSKVFYNSKVGLKSFIQIKPTSESEPHILYLCENTSFSRASLELPEPRAESKESVMEMMARYVGLGFVDRVPLPHHIFVPIF